MLMQRLGDEREKSIAPEEFVAYIEAEIPKWARVINKSGARME